MPMAIPRDRLFLLVTLATVALFQSHWLDDVATDDPDTAGILVSATGTLLLLAGLALHRRRAGRILMAVGFLFRAFVSMADLAGLGVDGTFEPNLVAHWRDTLGWGITVVGAITFALSLAGSALPNLTARTLR